MPDFEAPSPADIDKFLDAHEAEMEHIQAQDEVAKQLLEGPKRYAKVHRKKQDTHTRGHYSRYDGEFDVKHRKKREAAIAAQQIKEALTPDPDWVNNPDIEPPKSDAEHIAETRRVRKRVKRAVIEMMAKSVDQWGWVGSAGYDSVFGTAVRDKGSVNYTGHTSTGRIVTIRPSEMRVYKNILAQYPKVDEKTGIVDKTKLSDEGKSKLRTRLTERSRSHYSPVRGVEPLGVERGFIAKQIRQADEERKASKKKAPKLGWTDSSGRNTETDGTDSDTDTDQNTQVRSLSPDQVAAINNRPLTRDEKRIIQLAKKERHGVR